MLGAYQRCPESSQRIAHAAWSIPMSCAAHRVQPCTSLHNVKELTRLECPVAINVEDRKQGVHHLLRQPDATHAMHGCCEPRLRQRAIGSVIGGDGAAELAEVVFQRVELTEILQCNAVMSTAMRLRRRRE